MLLGHVLTVETVCTCDVPAVPDAADSMFPQKYNGMSSAQEVKSTSTVY